MIRSDVLVVGGGLAGLFAALVCAREKKKVTLVATGAGSFPLNSGVIDLLGYDDALQAVSDPLAAIENLADEHPYHKIGREAIEKSFAYFQEFMAEQGYDFAGSLHEQKYVPTAAGTLKPTCLVPLTMQGAELKDVEEILFVGFSGLKDYDEELVAANLAPRLGKKAKTVKVSMPREEGRDFITVDAARWLDTAEGRDSFVSQVKSQLGAKAAIVLPQILGTRRLEVYRELKDTFGCPLVEATGLPPSAAGLRLRDIIEEELQRLGVDLVRCGTATGALVEGKCVKGLLVKGAAGRETKFYAEKIILATGGFYSDGIRMMEFGAPFEPIFDLPISFEKDYEKFANAELFSDEKQGFAKVGIKTDGTLRAVDAEGNAIYENLYVVGRNLSGYDFCFEHSGNGVALSSAYKAAMA